MKATEYELRLRDPFNQDSVNIVIEKRKVKAFNQHEQHNETAIPLLLSVGMTNGRFRHYNFANRRLLIS